MNQEFQWNICTWHEAALWYGDLILYQGMSWAPSVSSPGESKFNMGNKMNLLYLRW
jgi:hypothetical protein